jgi:hypothetical protein
MDAIDSGGGNNQIPGRRETLFIAEFLPELDIEVAFGIFAADQAAHDQSIRHYLDYPLFSGGGRGPAVLRCGKLPVLTSRRGRR